VLDVLHVLARVVSIVAASIALLHVVKTCRAFKGILRDDTAEKLKHHSHVIQSSSYLTERALDVVIWAVIVGDLISAVRYFVEGPAVLGIPDLLWAAALFWLMRRGGGSGKGKTVSRLLGEKTRAMRDRLVSIQKGMQPVPNPA
jgi:hypothetical protein